MLIGQKYRLVRQLAQGGMAEVWIARNESLEIDVAIKFIRSDAQQGGASDRLLQEARAAARLGHPAIVRVHDFGEIPGGNPYIVMELLEGEDLASVLFNRGRVRAVRALQSLLPIAHALATAHEKGIIHRDLKPANVFLAKTDEGKIQPKLLDFGIAKMDRKGFERITERGGVFGSPAYMAPEQARGFDADQRTDVWAFCVVLYETLTGQLPFNGPNYNAIMRAIVEDDPASIVTFAAGDEVLWSIVERGLKKDPNERYSTMRELGPALAEWLLARDVLEDVAGGSLHAMWIQRSKPPLTLGSAAPPPLSSEVIANDPLVATEAPPTSVQPLTPVPGSRRRSWGWALLGIVLLGAAGFGIVSVLLRTHARSVASAPAPPRTEPAATLPAATNPPPAVEPGSAEEPASAPATAADPMLDLAPPPEPSAKVPPKPAPKVTKKKRQQPRGAAEEADDLEIKRTF